MKKKRKIFITKLIRKLMCIDVWRKVKLEGTCMRLKRKLLVAKTFSCLLTIDLISTLRRKLQRIEEAQHSYIVDHALVRFFVVVDRLFEYTYQRNKKKRWLSILMMKIVKKRKSPSKQSNVLLKLRWKRQKELWRKSTLKQKNKSWENLIKNNKKKKNRSLDRLEHKALMAKQSHQTKI